MFTGITHLEIPVRQNQTGKICFYLNLGCLKSSFDNLNLKHENCWQKYYVTNCTVFFPVNKENIKKANIWTPQLQNIYKFRRFVKDFSTVWQKPYGSKKTSTTVSPHFIQGEWLLCMTWKIKLMPISNLQMIPDPGHDIDEDNSTPLK